MTLERQPGGKAGGGQGEAPRPSGSGTRTLGISQKDSAVSLRADCREHESRRLGSPGKQDDRLGRQTMR